MQFRTSIFAELPVLSELVGGLRQLLLPLVLVKLLEESVDILLLQIIRRGTDHATWVGNSKTRSISEERASSAACRRIFTDTSPRVHRFLRAASFSDSRDGSPAAFPIESALSGESGDLPEAYADCPWARTTCTSSC